MKLLCPYCGSSVDTDVEMNDDRPLVRIECDAMETCGARWDAQGDLVTPPRETVAAER